MLFNQSCWYAIEIGKDRQLEDIKHIAIYLAAPISAITYIADIKDKGIELLDLNQLEKRVGPIKPEVRQSINDNKEEGRKYVIHFNEKRVQTLKTPVKPGKRVRSIQGHRYIDYSQLQHTATKCTYIR